MVETSAGEAAVTSPDNLTPSNIARTPSGKIAGRKKLTAKGERLAGLLAAGVPVVKAGEIAGYEHPSSDATRASQTPAVRARVIELQRRKLQRLSVVATARLAAILTGELPATAATVLDAIKYVHKAAGLDGEDDKAKEHKDLRLMTIEELERVAAVLRDKESSRITPPVPGDDAQVIDVTAEVTT